MLEFSRLGGAHINFVKLFIAVRTCVFANAYIHFAARTYKYIHAYNIKYIRFPVHTCGHVVFIVYDYILVAKFVAISIVSCGAALVARSGLDTM